ncbi:hypothetical protein TrCOL_g11256 [Triparma columacea]|uniref:Uncharacterized protein n=1 Tax=Triparma columacea TaxID=722753 RepID=A0A9W7GDL3_9STRA|nr:hypothetical protein TrCOL_g11256 [Triparma columacea]
MAASSVPRALYVGVAMVQNLLGGGLFFGWASISSTMLVAHTDRGGVGMTNSEITTIFTLATFVNFASPLILGILLDSQGPRSCSVLSNFLVCLGFFTFSLSSSYGGFMVATLLIAFGGPGVQNSIIHIGNLYPESASTITSFITGAFSLSFVIFAIFDVLWEDYNISFRPLFGVYGLVMLFSTTVSGFLWPDVAYNEKGELPDAPRTPPRQDPNEMTSLMKSDSVGGSNNSNYSRPPLGNHQFQKNKVPLNSYLRPNEDGQFSRNPSFVLSAAAIESGDYSVIKKISVKDQPFANQVKSGPFFRITLFFVVCSFWANFFIGTIGLQLGDSNNIDLPEQRRLTRLFSIISSLGVLGMPFVGFLLDNLGFAFTATTTVFLGVCYTFFALMEGSSAVYYCSFLFYSLYRAFLFTYFFAALPKKMGFKYFGILAGISFFVAGIAQLSMASLIKYATGTCHLAAFAGGPEQHGGDDHGDGHPECDVGNWKNVYFIQLLSFFFVFILPAIDTFLEKKQLNDLKQLFGTPTRISLSDKIKRGGGEIRGGVVGGSGGGGKYYSVRKPLSPIRAGGASEEDSSEASEEEAIHPNKVFGESPPAF